MLPPAWAFVPAASSGWNTLSQISASLAPPLPSGLTFALISLGRRSLTTCRSFLASSTGGPEVVLPTRGVCKWDTCGFGVTRTSGSCWCPEPWDRGSAQREAVPHQCDQCPLDARVYTALTRSKVHACRGPAGSCTESPAPRWCSAHSGASERACRVTGRIY